MTADAIEATKVAPLADRPLADVLARPGTRTVLLAGSRDPNAKATLLLFDDYGAAFVVKVPTTDAAQRAVRHEGQVQAALSGLRLGPLAATVPATVGYVSWDGRDALVSTALPGVPMTVSYHGWRHTARRRRVARDFRAAADWLADLQTRTAGERRPISLPAEAAAAVAERFADRPDVEAVTRRLAVAAERLAGFATPRTAVHGDYWFGNLLLDRDRVVGVVDWEAGATSGEPLRDVVRFVISYALYLDRHTRPGHRVAGHRGLRAGAWGAGIVHLVRGEGWFVRIARQYLTDALDRIGVPGHLWREAVLAGLADIAATADHTGFARQHLDLLAGLIADDPAGDWPDVPSPRQRIEPPTDVEARP